MKYNPERKKKLHLGLETSGPLPKVGVLDGVSKKKN